MKKVYFGLAVIQRHHPTLSNSIPLFKKNGMQKHHPNTSYLHNDGTSIKSIKSKR